MTAKQFIEQTAENVMDSLSQHPILKGAVPSFTGVALSFIDNLEQWMRLTGLGIGIVIGCLTAYLKVVEVIKKSRKK